MPKNLLALLTVPALLIACSSVPTVPYTEQIDDSEIEVNDEKFNEILGTLCSGKYEVTSGSAEDVEKNCARWRASQKELDGKHENKGSTTSPR